MRIIFVRYSVRIVIHELNLFTRFSFSALVPNGSCVARGEAPFTTIIQSGTLGVV